MTSYANYQNKHLFVLMDIILLERLLLILKDIKIEYSMSVAGISIYNREKGADFVTSLPIINLDQETLDGMLHSKH